jgi:hypothetical protein
MTSLAFIFGVIPLVWATGAGAELTQALGTAVFAGMIGVTLFGLIFTPVFLCALPEVGGAGSEGRCRPGCAGRGRYASPRHGQCNAFNTIAWRGQ